MINSSKNAKQHANHLHHSTGRGPLAAAVPAVRYDLQDIQWPYRAHCPDNDRLGTTGRHSAAGACHLD